MDRVRRILVVLVTVVSTALLMFGPSDRAALAYDGQVRVESSVYGDVGGYGGGEFNIKVDSWSYAPPITSLDRPYVPNGFTTFCVQTNQYFYWDTPYHVEIAGSTDHGSIIALKPEAAWLFHKWNSGALDYNYADDSLPGHQARALDAKALQYAIWYIQGQQQPYVGGDITDTWLQANAPKALTWAQMPRTRIGLASSMFASCASTVSTAPRTTRTSWSNSRPNQAASCFLLAARWALCRCCDVARLSESEYRAC